jgi:hypothetical protein
MPISKNTLRVLPNPFAHLDHEGLPAGTFPFDPIHHSPDRRWVGAVVDRSPGLDGQPKTRHLPQAGDLTAAIKDTRPGAAKGAIRRVHVDRAPRKRIVWAHAVEPGSPHLLPSTPHYLFGLRERSLIPADKASATKAAVPFVEPVLALKQAADKAIADWTQTYGEPPPTDDWPPNLRAAAGLPELVEPEAPAPPASTPTPPAEAAPASPPAAVPPGGAS